MVCPKSKRLVLTVGTLDTIWYPHCALSVRSVYQRGSVICRITCIPDVEIPIIIRVPQVIYVQCNFCTESSSSTKRFFMSDRDDYLAESKVPRLRISLKRKVLALFGSLCWLNKSKHYSVDGPCSCNVWLPLSAQ